jgi:hypothetical protein
MLWLSNFEIKFFAVHFYDLKHGFWMKKCHFEVWKRFLHTEHLCRNRSRIALRLWLHTKICGSFLLLSATASQHRVFFMFSSPCDRVEKCYVGRPYSSVLRSRSHKEPNHFRGACLCWLGIVIIFYRPQIRIPYIMIVGAPLWEKGIHGVDACSYILSPIYFIWYRWLPFYWYHSF